MNAATSRITLDHKAKKMLTSQLVAELKKRIVRGDWKPDGVLPGIFELAAQCKTSERVPRAALSILAKEGWVRPVRGIGSIVSSRDGRHSEAGRVLMYVRSTGWSYYFANLAVTIESPIRSAGYEVTTVIAGGRSETSACRRFEELLREQWSLVVIVGGRRTPYKLVVDSGMPFLFVGDGAALPATNVPACIGRIEVRSDKALPDFVRECAKRCVRSVVQFKYDEGPFDVSDILGAIGVSVETVPLSRRDTLEEVVRGALSSMRRYLSRRVDRTKLPDVFLFTDDYLAQGALLAMTEAGVRVPDDVCVVTHANKGLGPVWLVPLSRLEMDPIAHGRTIANAAKRYLERGEYPPDLVLGSVWKKGETF